MGQTTRLGRQRFDTLVELLLDGRDDDAFIGFCRGEGQDTRVGLGALRDDACRQLGALYAAGLQRGQHLVLFVDDCEAFVRTFWAAVLGGIVPVPLSPGGTPETLRKLANVCAKLGPGTAVFTEAHYLSLLQGRDGQPGAAGAATVLTPETCFVGEPALPERLPAADDVAFIQFSSGSTGDPKGVVLTHRNLLTNVYGIGQAISIDSDDVAMSWLPLTHDMGLIGFHLTLFVWGVPHHLMQPQAFFRHPRQWLVRLSQLRATLTASPNFGLKHVLKFSARMDLTGLDLSALRLIFNGAEPISAALCERFTAALAPAGLRAQAMFPVYGLAEASLAATFTEPGAPIRRVHLDRRRLEIADAVVRVPAGHPACATLVCVGRPVPHARLQLCDDAGRGVPEGSVGHIEIGGDNVTRRYQGAPEPAQSEQGWLRTGDLGVQLDGELYVVGRLKDVHINNGAKHHLSDLERVCEAVDGLQQVNLACGLVDGDDREEHLVVFIEDKTRQVDLAKLQGAVRQALYVGASLSPYDVVCVAKLPRTTSGKVQRGRLKELYAPAARPEAVSAADARVEPSPA